jgi:hypothetical protein
MRNQKMKAKSENKKAAKQASKLKDLKAKSDPKGGVKGSGTGGAGAGKTPIGD